MKRSALWIAIGIACCFHIEATFAGQEKKAESQPVTKNATFITKNCRFLAVVNAERFFASPELKSQPYAQLFNDFQELFGVETADLREIVATLDVTSDPTLRRGLILRSAKPFNQHRLVNVTFPTAVQARYASWTTYTAGNFALAFTDETTCVIGFDGNLGQMLVAANDPAPMLQEVRSLAKGVFAAGKFNMLPTSRGFSLLIRLGVSVLGGSDIYSRNNSFVRGQFLVDFADSLHAEAEISPDATTSNEHLTSSLTAQVKQAWENGQGLVHRNDPARGLEFDRANRKGIMVESLFRTIDIPKTLKDGTYYISSTAKGSPADLATLLLENPVYYRKLATAVAVREHMRTLAMAFTNFQGANGKLPDRAILSKDGKPLLSWRVALLPYLDQAELYSKFHLNEAWDSPHNRQFIEKIPNSYQSMLSDGVFPAGATPFQLPIAKNSLYAANRGPRLEEITDGPGATVLFVETDAARAVPWTKPADCELSVDPPLSRLQMRAHFFMLGLANGQVRAFSQNIEAKIFTALLTRHGGEPVDVDNLKRGIGD